MKLEIGKTYYFNYSRYGYPHYYMIYKVTSIYDDGRFGKYDCEIIVDMYHNKSRNRIQINTDSAMLIDTKELTDELKAELL